MKMKMRFILGVLQSLAFLILTCYSGTSNAVANPVLLSDLSVVCTLFFQFDLDISKNIVPGDICSAVSTYSEFGPHPPPPNTNIKDTFKGFPYVYIYDEYQYGEIQKKLHDDNVQDLIDHLNTLINDHKIDVMVFDFLCSKDHKGSSEESDEDYSEKFQNNLKSFLDKMKKTHENMLFGMKIHRDANVDTTMFNLVIIDSSIDFYVINSYGYHECNYEGSQKDMAQPPTKYELSKTIDDLLLVGYNVKKLFLTIEVVVKSWKNKYKENPEIWSYSWMCEAEPGKSRKYCRGTLENFYEQGQVIHDYKLPGVFVQAVDCDDYKNNCNCGENPALQAIKDGLMGHLNNTAHTNCHAFGLLKNEI